MKRPWETGAEIARASRPKTSLGKETFEHWLASQIAMAIDAALKEDRLDGCQMDLIPRSKDDRIAELENALAELLTHDDARFWYEGERSDIEKRCIRVLRNKRMSSRSLTKGKFLHVQEG